MHEALIEIQKSNREKRLAERLMELFKAMFQARDYYGKTDGIIHADYSQVPELLAEFKEVGIRYIPVDTGFYFDWSDLK